MDFNPIILSIPIYFLLIGIELLIERFSKRKLYRLNDAITNISCGVTQQLTNIFFKVLGVAAFAFVYEYRFFTIPENALTFILLFIAVDFCYYWAHRMSHEINLFWGGHVVHHQSEDYNFSVALRQGSFQILWTFSFYLPLALIGFNPTTFVFVSALVTVYQFWIHTETIGKLGWLEYVFNTPSHHRVHHGRDPKYIDRNHAGVFIVWDRLFGTFQEEEERPVYGITKPTNSWNPLWVNLAHYHQMWQTMKAIPSSSDKVRYIFYKPGWLPAEMGGMQPIPEVDRTSYIKYNPRFQRGVIPYVMTQYVIALLITAVFLFTMESSAWYENLMIVSLIIMLVVSCGGMLENRSWVTPFEFIRLSLSAGIVTVMHYALDFPFYLLPAAMLYAIVSAGWFFYLNRALKSSSVSLS
ncbi:sterol desaturase family protein [Fulvivirga sedimenti]|uniref:Sterol desaturase family protein n=1 Tax=Fulvivirga sedimenti TaxID=2879465 RepID=A0A9X1HP76_9BACT|nr:sterol desaturase family protein [Fulvivirga sedimenti]MCA6074612.1 sterol desaturase family protein [Fulvivirga sedimenti]MCA6075789.1 sterol desaturase family protein [Fulvivirga sedimenti]MCA6076917.1 sterol desaturase family protein [Fulvivirga sedimenti]